jgi:hypothetical protein
MWWLPMSQFEEFKMADTYTKVVLTVIAVCLALIAFRDATPIKTAKAENPTHVIIDSVATFAFQYAGPLEVRAR